MQSPQAPDPYSTSMAQQGMNTAAATAQQRLNMTSQTTPYGSLDYSADPNSPGGYRATQSYTQPVQNLINTGIGNAQGAGNIESALQGNVASAASKPLDLSWGATEQNINNLNRHTLDPLWQDRQNTFDQSMANKGLVPGSQAYTSAARDFGMQRDNSYENAALQGHQTAVNDITQQYNSPFNALASLRSSSMMPNQPSMGLTTTPQESIQAPNYMGAVNQNYQNQLQQSNATMGGLFGLGGTLGGGLAQGVGNAGGMAAFFSDERIKTDIRKVGELENGLPVYLFRYKMGGPFQIGLMAQDVEKLHPEAVHEIEGIKAVRYDMAVR